MAKSAYTEHYTIEDYRLWEGDWELVGGVPYAMAPSPAFTHQNVAAGIHGQLYEALESCPHCRALCAVEFDFSRLWRHREAR